MKTTNDEPTYSNAELWQEHQAILAKILMLEELIEWKNKTIANLRIINNSLSDAKSQLKGAETGRLSSTYQSNGDEHVLTDEHALTESHWLMLANINKISLEDNHPVVSTSRDIIDDLCRCNYISWGVSSYSKKVGQYIATDTGRAALKAHRERNP